MKRPEPELSSALKDAAARGRRRAAREQSQSLTELWHVDTRATSVQEKESFWVGLRDEFFKANTVGIRWTTQKDT